MCLFLKWCMMMLLLCKVVVSLVVLCCGWWVKMKLVVEGRILKFSVFSCVISVVWLVMIMLQVLWKQFLFLMVVVVLVMVGWFSGQELKLFLMCFSVLIRLVWLIVKLICMLVSVCDLEKVCIISRLGQCCISGMVFLLLKLMQVLLIIIMCFGLFCRMCFILFSFSRQLVGVLGLGKMMLLMVLLWLR